MLENGTLAVDADELEELLAEVDELEDLLAELFELLPHAATTTASAHTATDVHHQRLSLMLSSKSATASRARSSHVAQSPLRVDI